MHEQLARAGSLLICMDTTPVAVVPADFLGVQFFGLTSGPNMRVTTLASEVGLYGFCK